MVSDLLPVIPYLEETLNPEKSEFSTQTSLRMKVWTRIELRKAAAVLCP